MRQFLCCGATSRKIHPASKVSSRRLSVSNFCTQKKLSFNLDSTKPNYKVRLNLTFQFWSDNRSLILGCKKWIQIWQVAELPIRLNAILQMIWLIQLPLEMLLISLLLWSKTHFDSFWCNFLRCLWFVHFRVQAENDRTIQNRGPGESNIFIIFLEALAVHKGLQSQSD